ncbi:MAG: hypothetical protein ACRD2B_08595, partial [Terriglobia bacterium]
SETQLQKREVRGFHKHHEGCLDIAEVISEWEVGPGTYQTITSYYCTTAKGLYMVQLTNWQGDPKQLRLRATALKITLSLRSW